MKGPSGALLRAAATPPRGVLLAIMVVAVALVVLVGPGARPEATPGRAWAQGVAEPTADCGGSSNPLHGRTQKVVDVIMVLVPPDVRSDCADVTDTHLADLEGGLTIRNELTSLQANDFAGLAGLTTLSLDGNQLQTLPASLFAGLTSLQRLYLYSNRLRCLPANAFAGLTSLQWLYLYDNELGNVQPAFFAESGLTALQRLFRELSP